MDYSLLPKVDKLYLTVEDRFPGKYSRSVITEAARAAINELRQQQMEGSREELFDKALELTVYGCEETLRPSLRPVINATGVVLHTNLGRSPLAKEAMEAVCSAAGYCNLEMDLKSGKRGSRYDHLTEQLCRLTGAEDALVVNNNAAAVLLVLDTLAAGGQVIVSRGQLVEIGGSFRIPEIMERSGAFLREVGTTNKTHLQDYVRAICEETSCIMQVHPSNFFMDGFVEEVSTKELSDLARKNGLPFIYDLGSGCLYPLAREGIGAEPSPAKLIADGVDILTFSGDKLLGGPQAGIIVGKKEFIKEIKANQLTRALRVDKFTIAALEATLNIYRDGRESRDIPGLAMIRAKREDLRPRAERLLEMLGEIDGLSVRMIESVSQVGGGSLPGILLDTWVLEAVPDEIKSAELLSRMRSGDPSVLGYIHEDRACFDVRTISDEELETVAEAVRRALK